MRTPDGYRYVEVMKACPKRDFGGHDSSCKKNHRITAWRLQDPKTTCRKSRNNTARNATEISAPSSTGKPRGRLSNTCLPGFFSNDANEKSNFTTNEMTRRKPLYCTRCPTYSRKKKKNVILGLRSSNAHHIVRLALTMLYMLSRNGDFNTCTDARPHTYL